jgi:hypothetical protein
MRGKVLKYRTQSNLTWNQLQVRGVINLLNIILNYIDCFALLTVC